MNTERLNGHAAELEVLEPKPLGFGLKTLKELKACTPPVTYDIQGVLAAGQPCALLGRSKTLKTSIMLDMALSLATGSSFLETFEVLQKRRVAVMSSESGVDTLLETLEAQIAAKGLDMEEIGRDLMLTGETPTINDELDLRTLADMVDDHGTEVLVIDPFYLSVRTEGKESSMYFMGQALKGLAKVLVPRGITLVLCHHIKEAKSGYARPGDLKDSAYSGLEQFARQWLIVNRKGKYKGGGLHNLELEVGGSAKHYGHYKLELFEGTRAAPDWKATVTQKTELEVDTTTVRKTAKRTTLLKAFEQYPDGEIPATVATDIGDSNPSRVKKECEAAVADGDLHRIEVTRGNKTIQGYVHTMYVGT
jgi:hypothetical protein